MFDDLITSLGPSFQQELAIHREQQQQQQAHCEGDFLCWVVRLTIPRYW